MNDRKARSYPMFGTVQTSEKDNASDFAALAQILTERATQKAQQDGDTAPTNPPQ